MKASAKDLRFHSKEILDTVSRGEEVVITFRGKPHAKIVPIDTDEKGQKSDLKLFGIWKDHQDTKDVEKYVRDLRKGRKQ